MGELQERITSTQRGLGDLDPGRLRARRRPHRPGPGVGVRPPERDHDALAGDLARRGSTRRWTRSTRPRRSSSPTSSGEEHYRHRDRGPGEPAALQGAAGHHRDPRHRRALRRGQADGQPRAQDRALPQPAVLRRRAVHRPRRRVRAGRRDGPPLPRDRRRRARRHPRARLLHEGLDRAGARGSRGEGRGDEGVEREAAESEAAKEAEAEEAGRGAGSADGRRHTLHAEVLTPEGEVFERRAGPALDPHRRSARSASSPATSRCSRACVPTELRLHRSERRGRALRAGRGLARGVRQPRPGAGRRGDPARAASTPAELRGRLADAEQRLGEAEEGSRPPTQAERDGPGPRPSWRSPSAAERRAGPRRAGSSGAVRSRCGRRFAYGRSDCSTEKLIGYDTSTAEGIKLCAGLHQGLARRRARSRPSQIDCPRPAGDHGRGRARRGARRRAPARPPRRRARAARSSSRPRVDGDRLLRPRRLRHEGRAGGDAARDRRPARRRTTSGCGSGSSPTRSPRRRPTAAATCWSTEGFLGDFAITGEPTDLHVGVAAKGVLAMRASGRGPRRARRDAVAGRERDPAGRSTSSAAIESLPFASQQLGAVRPALDQPRPDPGR